MKKSHKKQCRLAVPIFVALAAGAAVPVGAQTATRYNNGVALTPALGWSSWSALRFAVSDSIIRSEADVMHAQLQTHGYQYINIDDGWYADNTQYVDAYGRLLPDPAKFPNGIKAVADYVHSLGLKFGIYEKPDIPKAAVQLNTPILGTSYHASDIIFQPARAPWPAPQLDLGSYEIDWSKPGAQAYIQSCADQLAAWGVDYVKLDWINATINLNTDLPAWGTALKNTGRPIYFQISNYLQVQPPYGATIVANSNGWRDNPDVETYNGANSGGFNLPITDWSHVTDPTRLANGQKQDHTTLGAAGGWNDMDSLELGWSPANSGLTADERQYMYAFWSICTSPLLIGSDLAHLDPTDLPLLQNDEVIACDQAPYEPTYSHMANSNWQRYWKPSGDGGYYVMFANILNPADPGNPGTVSIDFEADLGLSGAQPVRDLFARTSLGSMTSLSKSLAGHSAMLFKIGGSQNGASAPTNLAATPGNGQIGLTWSAVSGASGYNVYRNNSTVASAIGGTSYTDTGLTNGTSYTYAVSAIVNGTEGPKSQSVSSTPQGQAAVTSGTYNIVNQLSGYALDDPAGGGSGTKLDQQPVTGGNQQWVVTALGGGNYSIKTASGLAIGAPTGNTQLVLEPATGAAEQTWTFVTNGSSLLIKNNATGCLFDDYGGSGSTGNPIYAWSQNGGTNQNWKLTAVSAPQAPAVPTGVSAAAGNAQVTVGWSAVSGAASYNVYRSTTAGGEGTTAYRTGLTSTSFTDTGLTNGTRYYYKVAAVNSAGTSAQSAEASAVPAAASVPAAPSGLTASPGSTQVALSWSGVSGATSYSVYRNGTRVASGLTTTSYTNTGLTNGTSYSFQVTAVNGAGESAKSTAVSATPAGNSSGINLSGSANSSHVVSLSWTSSVPNVSYYEVFRGTAAGGEGSTPLDYPSGTTWQDNFAPSAGTKYFYVVRAVDIYGTLSSASNEVSVTP